MMATKVLRDDLVYPELSFKLIGCAFEVFNQLGYGHYEKYYQKAYAEALKNNKIEFTEQVYSPLKFNDIVIGKLFFDFLIENKIIVELKKDNHFAKRHIDQVNEYLKTSNHKLAILINFTSKGVIYKRLVNIH